ncbi:GNAT family N-acetyltransferase [Ilumatobacter nonamiensis]|uniref:GNAT family N-acetyltransferase n=1 Tax=Ilumatobacter nonamiensis TaxID=467093 RepID=UPI0003470CA0|nr:GNAT family N-acetyltransferase [Ilumatobacter nonamiensis]
MTSSTGLANQPGVHLVTERMVLRRFTTNDLDALVELDNDPEVMHYINNGAPVDADDVADTLDHWIAAYHRTPGFGFWAADDRRTGDFIGWFHFRPAHYNIPPEPELGYRLRRNYWGRGLATEGARALIDNGFEQHPIERVVAETMVVHTASRRVMEKAGLRPTRTFRADWPVRIPGDEHGDVEYALTRNDWKHQQRSMQSTSTESRNRH